MERTSPTNTIGVAIGAMSVLALAIAWIAGGFDAFYAVFAVLCVLSVFGGSMYAEWPQRED